MTDRQTQTHAVPSIYVWAKIFMPFFDTFLFTTFVLVTPFVKDNLKKLGECQTQVFVRVRLDKKNRKKVTDDSGALTLVLLTPSRNDI